MAMSWWLVGAGLAVVALALSAFALSAMGERRWRGVVLALQAALAAAGSRRPSGLEARPDHYHVRELDGLPAPVQRYFRAVLQDGQPIITGATIDMAGTFNLSPDGAQWRPFTSHQRITTRRPGFLWDARVAVFPGLSVRVVDSYVAGTGLLRAAVQGLVPVAQMQGDGEIARGECMRWFAEVLWVPTALLPSQGVRWDPVDASSANATMVDGPISLTLRFRFDDAGLITSFRAEARGGMVGGRMVMAPWEGVWSDYRMQDGVRVPFTGEVAWMRAEGRRPYFVGSVTEIALEFTP
jgi:hypothetical protein